MRFTEIESLPGTWFKASQSDVKFYIVKAKKPGRRNYVEITYISIPKSTSYFGGLRTEVGIDWNITPLGEEEKEYREVIKLAFKE